MCPNIRSVSFCCFSSTAVSRMLHFPKNVLDSACSDELMFFLTHFFSLLSFSLTNGLCSCAPFSPLSKLIWSFSNYVCAFRTRPPSTNYSFCSTFFLFVFAAPLLLVGNFKLRSLKNIWSRNSIRACALTHAVAPARPSNEIVMKPFSLFSLCLFVG